MPLYEVTVITRPLSKSDLATAIKRASLTLFNYGGVITDIQNLGHRDLPHRRVAKGTGEHVYASNYFLFNSYMNRKSFLKAYQQLRNDLDLVHIGYVNESEMVEQPAECKLEELLHPPAYRESVEKLRSMQKLSHHTKRQLFDKTKAEWRKLPKSYPIMNMLR